MVLLGQKIRFPESERVLPNLASTGAGPVGGGGPARQLPNLVSTGAGPVGTKAVRFEK